MRDRLYYDGVRRIQEVSTTVVPGSGGPVTTCAVREYVWGPEYVDEIIAQVATNPLLPAAPPMMTAYLTDANYNVTGLVGDLNDGGGQGVEPLTVKQYTWDPYGAVVLTEDHDTVAIPFNRLGHQGLCFERFCVDPDEPMNDGGMGSLRLTSHQGHSCSIASELLFTDADGVPVMASLFVDDVGIPRELDLWKVNYQPLIEIPAALPPARRFVNDNEQR